MASHIEENYLKSMFLLDNLKGEITLSDLSKVLKISIPTANSMVNKLHSKGLLNYEKYKPLVLTAKGRKEAALVIRKHRLTEMFLFEFMGFGWELVHDIAEQIEHIKSPVFFDRMDELMSFPTIDPHGSPIPDKHGKIILKLYKKLTECAIGHTVQLAALASSSSEFLNFLNTKDLSLGLKIKILSIEAFDKSMVISYPNHKKEQFSQLICDRLLVTRN